jgi:hypothetical protein
MKKITQQEVIDLLKTSKVDENGHLFITLELYNNYYLWFLGTLKQKNRRDFLEMKWNHPTKFQSTLCNFIGGSYQSVNDFTPISTVCIELLDGSYDYVNV